MIRHHPLRVCVAASRLQSCSICPSHHRNKFSTQSAATEKKESKSPHSKLLRICSSRNANPHFAAVEGELLRLDWNKSMNNLVSDWSKNKRFEDFVELESNVQGYVEKNSSFITLERSNNESNERLILEHFPYELIISNCVRFAVSSTPDKDGATDFGSTCDKNEVRNASLGLQARMESLSSAGKLLEAMSALDMEDEHNCTHDGAAMVTSYRKSCSNCFRLIVSGWFLLSRKQQAMNNKFLATMNASDIMSTTAKLNSLPDAEAYAWANTWISFHAKSGGGGILQSDRAIFSAIVNMLETTNRKEMANEFSGKLEKLFAVNSTR